MYYGEGDGAFGTIDNLDSLNAIHTHTHTYTHTHTLASSHAFSTYDELFFWV